MDDELNVKTYAEVRSEIAHEQAKKLGLVVVEPKPNELFVDLDSEEQCAAFDKCIAIFEKRHRCLWTKRPSPSGEPHHFHVRVRLLAETIDAQTRVLYQATLGSDPVRECLSLQRLALGDTMPTLFFEKP
jgi:hypothetical protein